MLQARPVNLGLPNIAASVICGHLRAIARGAPNHQSTSREDVLGIAVLTNARFPCAQQNRLTVTDAYPGLTRQRYRNSILNRAGTRDATFKVRIPPSGSSRHAT